MIVGLACKCPAPGLNSRDRRPPSWLELLDRTRPDAFIALERPGQEAYLSRLYYQRNQTALHIPNYTITRGFMCGQGVTASQAHLLPA